MDQRIFPKFPYKLILTYQHIKNAPGKLMSVLWKPYPNILSLTHTKDRKIPQGKDSAQAHSRACPCPFSDMNFLFPPKLQGFPGDL